MDTVLSLNAVPVILPPLSEMLLVCDKQLTGNTLKLLGRIYLPKKSFLCQLLLFGSCANEQIHIMFLVLQQL